MVISVLKKKQFRLFHSNIFHHVDTLGVTYSEKFICKVAIKLRRNIGKREEEEEGRKGVRSHRLAAKSQLAASYKLATNPLDYNH